MITIAAHPLLDVAWLKTTFAMPLGELSTPDSVMSLLVSDATAPLSTDDRVRQEVRQMLRHGGYRPSGRGKPSAEYLQKAVGDDRLGSINPAVDICNVVSLHSGLPISVIDLDQTREPFSIGVAGQGDQYVFNAAGQTIDLAGLLCLSDSLGPCANAVKDSQRTKTGDKTTSTLSVIWGSMALPDRTRQAADWYGSLLAGCAASVELATAS